MGDTDLTFANAQQTLSTEQGAALLLAGMVGGVALGYYALNHLFVEGLTEEERRGFLALATGGLLVVGAKMIAGIDESWMTVEGLAQKAEQATR